MYAIIETGGRQYKVQDGDVLRIEKLSVQPGEKIQFDKVLVLNDGTDFKYGSPYIEGATVSAEVVENGKAKKVIIYKYKAKKDYRKKQGHRQPYTEVKIESVLGKATTKKVANPKTAAEDKKADIKPGTSETPKATKKTKVSASMKKDELIAFAKENDIEIDPKSTKPVIIEAINNALSEK